MADLDFTLNFSIPTAAPYSISKAALNMMIVKYHNVYKGEGILFMGVSPGLVDTGEDKICEFCFFCCLHLQLRSFLWSLIRFPYPPPHVLLPTPTNSPTDTPEELEGLKKMVGAFKEYAPNFEGPITPQQSVDMVLKVIDEATLEKNGGGFVSHYGNKQWLWRKKWKCRVEEWRRWGEKEVD